MSFEYTYVGIFTVAVEREIVDKIFTVAVERESVDKIFTVAVERESVDIIVKLVWKVKVFLRTFCQSCLGCISAKT